MASFPALREPLEHRVGFDGELIERDMVAHAGERRLQFRFPRLHALVRPGIDQIERIAIEDLRGDIDGVARLGGIVQPAERLEVGIVEGLHADRDAVDPGGAVIAKARRLDARRIGFERDFDVGRHGPMFGDGLQHAGDAFRLHQRGRAAAEEDRAHGTAFGEAGAVGEFGRDGGNKTPLIHRLRADVAVEVAIRAFRQAERPVDVNPEARIGSGLARHAALCHAQVIRSSGQGHPPTFCWARW